MRIAIIDADCSGPTYPRDVVRHLVAGGAVVIPVDVASLALDVTARAPRVLASGVPLEVDVVLTRRVALFDVLIAPALELLERSGVWVCNPTAAASTALDKTRTALVLTHAGVPTVPGITVPCTPAARTLSALAALTGPLVVKPATGGGGVGVVRVESAEAAANHIERLSTRLDFTDPEMVVASSRHYVVQPLTGDGVDYRIFVLNGEPIACTRRTVAPGEFRTNGSYGSTDEPWWDPEIAALAARATTALGLHYAGVDVLVGFDGPAVLEVNGWAGFAHTEHTTGVPIAHELARFLLAGRPR